MHFVSLYTELSSNFDLFIYLVLWVYLNNFSKFIDCYIYIVNLYEYLLDARICLYFSLVSCELLHAARFTRHIYYSDACHPPTSTHRIPNLLVIGDTHSLEK